MILIMLGWSRVSLHILTTGQRKNVNYFRKIIPIKFILLAPALVLEALTRTKNVKFNTLWLFSEPFPLLGLTCCGFVDRIIRYINVFRIYTKYKTQMDNLSKYNTKTYQIPPLTYTYQRACKGGFRKRIRQSAAIPEWKLPINRSFVSYTSSV